MYIAISAFITEIAFEETESKKFIMAIIVVCVLIAECYKESGRLYDTRNYEESHRNSGDVLILIRHQRKNFLVSRILKWQLNIYIFHANTAKKNGFNVTQIVKNEELF